MLDAPPTPACPEPVRAAAGPSTATVDAVVVGGGAVALGAAWHLARAGRSVVLVEERTSREVRRAARGTAWSAHPGWLADDQAPVLAEAVGWWRDLERETGGVLLDRHDAVVLRDGAPQRVGAAWRVRSDLALSALAAAAVGRGAVVRHGVAVRGIDVVGEEVEVRTAAGPVRARRAVMTAPPAAPRGVELHVPALPGGSVADVVVAHHDPAVGLVRAAPCTRGHLAVGVESWHPDRADDLRAHLASWFGGLDVARAEAVDPAARSTATPRTAVRADGPLVAVAAGALGSVLAIAEGREVAGALSGR